MTTVNVKVSLDGNFRRFSLNKTTKNIYDNICQKISHLYHIERKAYRLVYIDEDNDQITITSSAELEHGLKYCQPKNCFRLEVLSSEGEYLTSSCEDTEEEAEEEFEEVEIEEVVEKDQPKTATSSKPSTSLSLGWAPTQKASFSSTSSSVSPVVAAPAAATPASTESKSSAAAIADQLFTVMALTQDSAAQTENAAAVTASKVAKQLDSALAAASADVCPAQPNKKAVSFSDQSSVVQFVECEPTSKCVIAPKDAITTTTNVSATTAAAPAPAPAVAAAVKAAQEDTKATTNPTTSSATSSTSTPTTKDNIPQSLIINRFQLYSATEMTPKTLKSEKEMEHAKLNQVKATCEVALAKRQEKINHHVDCSECGRKIMGTRFLCGSCDAYDLCAECEAHNLHPYHPLFRICDPEVLQKANFRWVPHSQLAQYRITQVRDEKTVKAKLESSPGAKMIHLRNEAAAANRRFEQARKALSELEKKKQEFAAKLREAREKQSSPTTEQQA